MWRSESFSSSSNGYAFLSIGAGARSLPAWAVDSRRRDLRGGTMTTTKRTFRSSHIPKRISNVRTAQVQKRRTKTTLTYPLTPVAATIHFPVARGLRVHGDLLAGDPEAPWCLRKRTLIRQARSARRLQDGDNPEGLQSGDAFDPDADGMSASRAYRSCSGAPLPKKKVLKSVDRYDETDVSLRHTSEAFRATPLGVEARMKRRRRSHRKSNPQRPAAHRRRLTGKPKSDARLGINCPGGAPQIPNECLIWVTMR